MDVADGVVQLGLGEVEAREDPAHVRRIACWGAALIVRAPASRLPLAFEVAGWLLVVSSLLILLAPIRWHGAYGTWWANALTLVAIRRLSPVPAVLCTGLIFPAI